jgi:alkylation response protein AidB-like acyl-CoA dehydrogenase
MRFALTSEQQELADVTRRFLISRCGMDDVRRVIETPAGHDPQVWAELAQLGLLGLAVPEEYGGSGASLVEVAVVLREAGRALLPAPLLATTIASCALLQAEDKATVRHWLTQIAEGETIATFASGHIDSPAADTTPRAARPASSRWVLTGDIPFVLSGAVANLLVVAASVSDEADGQIGLFAIPVDAPGVVRTALPTLDPTRTMASVTLAGTPATPVAIGRGGVQRVLDLAAVLLAAEQVGGAERCLDSATEYAKLRVQFGSPIGSFQAIKHLLADLLLEVESARAASDYAAWVATSAPSELSTAAPLAKAVCSDTYLDASKVNFQVHGGIAFTWEHDAHLHLKRAMAGKQLFGSPEIHRDRLANQVLVTGGA